MSLRTYRAGTMKEALAQVRRDLGGGAVILGTREVRRRRIFGLGSRERGEVTRPAGSERSAGAAPTALVAAPSTNVALPSQFGEQRSRLHAMVEDLSKHG